MNRLPFCFLAALCIQFAFQGNAQSPQDGLVMHYEYQNMGSSTRQHVAVYVKGPESLSLFSASEPITNSEPEHKDFSISGEDSIGRQVYRNLSTRELIFRDFAPIDGEFHAFIVKDPLTQMKWSFTNEKSAVGDKAYKKATTSFRGRNYEAWYTEEIAVSHGPWKFSGLPGAIAQIRSVDGVIQFKLVRIEKLGQSPIKISSDGKSVSMSEYINLRKDAINDFIRTLKAKLPRGAEVSVETSGDYNLETDFSDVKK